MDHHIAVVGATGQIGEALLAALADAGISSKFVHAIASAESAGKRVGFGNSYLTVADLASADLSGVELALLAVPPASAASLAEKLAGQGILVVDLSGVLLADPSVPMVVPGLNDAVLVDCRERNLVACADGVVTSVVALLRQLQGLATVQAVDLTVLQPASRFGGKAVEELASQTARLLGSQQPDTQVFPERLAFAVLEPGRKPLGSGPVAYAASTEVALQRLFAGDGIDVSVASAVMPLFFGQAVQLRITTDRELDVPLLRERLLAAGMDVTGLNDEGDAVALAGTLPEGTVRVADLRALPGQRAGISL
ncbi:MAG: NAD(P)-binding domain-containing protein, partial [Alcanivoracaceae bacterium]